MKKIAPAIILCAISNTVLANLGDFQIDGFLSIGAAWSNVDYLTSGVEPTYLSYIQHRPGFEKDTNVGIQITKFLRDDVSITTQLLAEAQREFNVEATWAFLKYEPNDHWQFRVGRVRTNPYMLSDYVNVGYAYPWIRPPQEVYSMVPASFTNFTGVDARFKFLLFKKDFSITGFYGAGKTHLSFPMGPIPVFPPLASNSLFDEVTLRLRDLISFNMKYGDEVFSIRAGYESASSTIYPNAGTVMENLNQFLNGLVASPFVNLTPDYINYFSDFHKRVSFMGIGYQFDWNNIVSMGELVSRRAATPIVANVIGWYVMGGYRVKQLLPHVTFGREKITDNKTRRFPSIVNNIFTAPIPFGAGSPLTLDSVAGMLVNTSQFYDGGAGCQSSVTLGIRWDLYEGIAIKADYQHIHPDKLSPGLFDVNPLKSVNIYSLAVDAVM